MAFQSGAIAYYVLHIISLPLSLFLFIVYKNHKYHSSIAYFALTLFFSSINSCFLAFVNNGNMEVTANTYACGFQAFFVSYLNSSIAIWPVCIESSLTLTLRRRGQQRREDSRKRTLGFMALALGLPLFLTTVAFVLAVGENGLKPLRLYYCMISGPAIGPAIGIYFVSLCAVTATIVMSAWNVKLISNQEDQSESEDDLPRRIIFFGIAVSLPICLVTIARSSIILTKDIVDKNGMWPDFLLVAIPYFVFVIFGTKSELIKRFLSNSTRCQRNDRDSLLLRFSIINPTLRREIPGEEETFTEKSSTEKSSSGKPSTEKSKSSTEKTSSRSSIIPGPSTFSRRPDSNDPFSHRKNPSLTIDVPKNKKNRISKGKNRSSVARRQSFLARALSIHREIPSSNVENYDINLQNPRKVVVNKKRFSRRQGNRDSVNNDGVFDFDMNSGRKPRFLRTFSFEYRKRGESIIGIPPEYVESVYDPESFFSHSNSSNRSRNKHLKEFPPSIEITKHSTPTPVNYREMKSARNNKQKKPPPLALIQNEPQKSPSFFFLTSDHYNDDANDDEYTNLPVTPSFGMSSSSRDQMGNTRSSLSSKSNNSSSSSKSYHGGGLRLTPKDNIPVRILNINVALLPPTYPTNEENNK